MDDRDLIWQIDKSFLVFLMRTLQNTIDEITAFGTNPNLTDRSFRLKVLLVEIYLSFLTASYEEEDALLDKEKEPTFEYEVIRSNVESNFPDFGWYRQILEPEDFVSDPGVAIGDAIDDLTDIIKDLLIVRWKMELTSENDALKFFKMIMRAHSEQHLVDLLKYIKDKEN